MVAFRIKMVHVKMYHVEIVHVKASYIGQPIAEFQQIGIPCLSSQAKAGKQIGSLQTISPSAYLSIINTPS